MGYPAAECTSLGMPFHHPNRAPVLLVVATGSSTSTYTVILGPTTPTSPIMAGPGLCGTQAGMHHQPDCQSESSGSGMDSDTTGWAGLAVSASDSGIGYSQELHRTTSSHTVGGLNAVRGVTSGPNPALFLASTVNQYCTPGT